MTSSKKISLQLPGWILSAAILPPSLLLTILTGFKVDYHYRFHIWYGVKVLNYDRNSFSDKFSTKDDFMR